MRPAPLIQAALVMLCVLASATRAQASPAPPPTDAQRFDALARKGDRARAAGRPSDAVVAYADALEIKNDPVIAGRLGLILLEAGTSPEATHLLLEAVESAHETSPDERLRFFRGYDAARARVCRIDITVSEAHARVTVDGVPRNPRGNTEFFLFVAPGQREVRASLPGYEDALVLVDAKAGRTEPVRLTLRPISAAQSPAAEEEKPVAVLPPPPPPTPPPSTPLPITKPAPKPRAPASLWSVGLGPAGVFGGVPPSFGFVLSTRRRLTDLFSIDADMRIAWSAAPIADRPIGVLTVGALLAPCAHARGIYGAWRFTWDCFSGSRSATDMLTNRSGDSPRGPRRSSASACH
jgi:hypothetical protein